MAAGARRGELCLRRARPRLARCAVRLLDPSVGPSRLCLAQLTSAGQPQVLVAGQAFLSIAGWPADQPLTIAQRYPLTLPAAQVERSRGWRGGGESATDVVDRYRDLSRSRLHWLWPGAPAGNAVTAPVPIDFALSAAATALLPVSPGRDGGRELFVATRPESSTTAVGARTAGCPVPSGWRGACAWRCSTSMATMMTIWWRFAADGTLQAVERRASPSGWVCLDEAPFRQPGRSLLWLAAADFDGDGKRDLLAATAERSEGTSAVATWAADLRYPLSAPARAVSVADGDGDGEPDVAVVLSDGSLEFFHNSFAPRWDGPPPSAERRRS